MGAAESYYHLRKAVGDDMFISSRWYRTQKNICGLSTEKVPGAGFTGLNTKNCELLTINFRDCEFDVGNAYSIPTKMFVALQYDAILNIRDSGVEILE
eukprot:8393797-Heterocapsa_arctica.AAC.1